MHLDISTKSVWIKPQDPSTICAFKREFELQESTKLTITVTADQRYILYLNGERIGRGSERGDIDNWYAEEYTLELEKGKNILTALVWCLPKELRPHAQISRDRLMFLVATQEEHLELLATGNAHWQYKNIEGIYFDHPGMINTAQWMTGTNLVIDASDFDYNCFRLGKGDNWQDAQNVNFIQTVRGTAHYGILYTQKIKKAPLALQIDRKINPKEFSVRAIDDCEPTKESIAYKIVENSQTEKIKAIESALKNNKSITVPANTSRRIIIDFNQYYCAYPEITVSGGKNSIIRLGWAEAIFEKTDGSYRKGHRDEVFGKYFDGKTDIFLPDGGQRVEFCTLWWKAGRYIELIVKTEEEPLVIENISFFETRYPLEMETSINVSHDGFMKALPIMWRTLQMCSHETYMDCPYYEQLQYIGDTRLQVLVTYMTTNDIRLPKKAIDICAASQHPDGLVLAHYPSYTPQIIPQFALYWIGMLYDFALWRGDKNYIKSHLFTMRSILECYITKLRDDGLVDWPEGWDWNDWPEEWQKNDGTKEIPTTFKGLCSINQFLLVYISGLAIEIEEWIGDKTMAQRLKDFRATLMIAIRREFWCEETRAFALGNTKKSFTEHTQCFAVLSGMLNEDELAGIKHNLLHNETLHRATVYFKHYLFETYYALDCTEEIVKQLDFWSGLVDRGFKTTIESPEPSRSDCHAWGAHPIYHVYASLLGVRPNKLGDRTLVHNPKPGGIEKIEATMADGNGSILKLKL
ncbi:MAG: hypothetical protein PF692_04500 [Kiritimatiellae bacterium]|jgi:alpha-L-rhamnosidase|nr:hypothetical protein [Kiritimatiellia bacterium]